MDIRQKLAILADAAKYDASCASSGARRRGRSGELGHSDGVGICHSYTPDGRCISLLKLLLTNYCVYDCRFCVNRVSAPTRRARFTPREVVELTLAFYRRNYIEGLFLSSGIFRSPDYTMEQVIAVARSLRSEHRFNGYIHLKTVPGAAPELVDEAGRWADRLSVNVELPTAAELERLAPEKDLTAIETTMAEIRRRRDAASAERRASPRAPAFAPAGQSTQMVVGAGHSSDRDILATATRLYRRHRLKRIYYSAYSPIPGADPRLPPAAPPLEREHRLYQADWLMRVYGFAARELTSSAAPDLALDLDPKSAWALAHRELFPLDVNRAPRELLLRVPGLGVRNVERVLSIRRHHALSLADLAKLRVALRRAAHFLVTADHVPRLERLSDAELRRRLASRSPTSQLDLFTPADFLGAARGGPAAGSRRAALTGEL